MELYLNDLPLHDLGHVIVRQQGFTFEPAEAPQREKVTMSVRVVFNQPTWADNYELVKAVRAALRQQEARLLWKNDNGAVQLDRRVTVGDNNLPEDPNAWGTRQQAIELSFSFYEKNLSTNNLNATYQRLGENRPLVTITGVYQFNDRYSSARVSAMRKHRVRDGGTVVLKGKFLPNPALTVPQRRAQMIEAATAWKTEIQADGEGRLIYGTFNQIVRVDEFDCDVDQATNEIPWSLTATFTRFPNEEDYASAEFTVRTRTDRESGQVFLSIAGKIGAATRLQALNKLTALQAAYVTGGYQLLSHQDTDQMFSGNDGSTFLELSFEDEYQKGVESIVRWNLKVSDTEDSRTRLIRRVFSGSVTASASTFDAAQTAATAKARELGDNKYQFRVTGGVTVTDQQTLTPAPRHVTVEFSFEYELKASKIYLELSSETTRAMFEENAENVSGFVVAVDMATARSVYATLVRNAYNGRLVRNERTGEAKQIMQSVNLANGALQSGQNVTREMRMEFSFSVHLEKTDGEVGIKYALEVRRNFKTLERNTSIQGKVYARDVETETDGGVLRASGKKIRAEVLLDTFLTSMGLGKPVELSTREDVDFWMGNPANEGERIRKALVLEFSATYEGRVTGEEGLIECRVTDEIEHSGTRWVVQGIPDGRDVVQPCGIMSGRRTISGSVTAPAAAEEAAKEWAHTHYERLTGPNKLPPRFSVPRYFTAFSAGTNEDVRLVEVSFTFSEILTNADYAG